MKFAFWSVYSIFAAAMIISVILPSIFSGKAINELKQSQKLESADTASKDYVYGNIIQTGRFTLTVYPRPIFAWMGLFGLIITAVSLYFCLHVPRF